MNGKGTYPYFPRISWAEELKLHNILYISDPYQPFSQYKTPMGSWFISPDGELTLNFLAEKIKKFIEQINVDNVIFYGSSMGGYAAIILSSLVHGSKSIAECPQLYLSKHPGSRFVCENILNKNVHVEDIEPLNFLKKNSPKHLRIICSMFDRHHSQHIIPFMNDIQNHLIDGCTNISFSSYIDLSYTKGHVALKKDDALRVIRDVFEI